MSNRSHLLALTIAFTILLAMSSASSTTQLSSFASTRLLQEEPPDVPGEEPPDPTDYGLPNPYAFAPNFNPPYTPCSWAAYFASCTSLNGTIGFGRFVLPPTILPCTAYSTPCAAGGWNCVSMCHCLGGVAPGKQKVYSYTKITGTSATRMVTCTDTSGATTTKSFETCQFILSSTMTRSCTVCDCNHVGWW